MQFGGNFSEGRATATGEAAGDLVRSLTQARAQFTLEREQQQQQRILQALGLVPGVSSAPAQRQGAQIQALVNALSGVSGAESQAFGNRLSLIQTALGIPAFENVVTALPGTEGFLTGAAPGIGAAAFAPGGFLGPAAGGAGAGSAAAGLI